MMDEFLLGTCQVQLKHLNFDLCREPLQEATARLQHFIQHHCDPLNNPVPAAVTPNELRRLLTASALSISHLTTQAPYPQIHLPPDIQLCCLHGR